MTASFPQALHVFRRHRKTRVSKSRRRRALAAARRGVSLHREQLEQRLALAVDIYNPLNAPWVVITSDNADDVYLQQIATVNQNLLVADNSGFNNYQTIGNINALTTLAITNGTGRSVTNLPHRGLGDSLTTAFLLVDPPGQIRFDRAITGQLSYGGNVWSFTNNANGRDVVFTLQSTSPTAASSPSLVFPVSGFVRDSLKGSGDTADATGRSALVVSWNSPPTHAPAPALTVRYEGQFGADRRLTTTPSSDFRPQFSLPVNGDRVSGIVPGTLSGSISVPDGGTLRFRVESRSSGSVPLLFENGSTTGLLLTQESVRPTVREVTGSVNTRTGVVSLEFRTRRVLTSGGGIIESPILQDPGPVTLSASYAVYSRDTLANTVTFAPGLDFSRDLDVDLLTPNSTLNINSPVRQTSGGASLSLAATNINFNAQASSDGRFTLGPSAVNRTPLLAAATARALVSAAGTVSRISIPGGSGGQGYDDDPDNAPAVQISGGGGSGATARAVVANGVVIAVIVTNPGSGYTSIPAVTIDAPPPNDVSGAPRFPSLTAPIPESVQFNAAVSAGIYDIRTGDDPATTGINRGRLFVSPSGSLSGAGSIFVQADTADMIVEGKITAATQTYLMRSPVSASDRAPFFFTTKSPVTGADTGLISGTNVAVTLANDLETPDNGGAAVNKVSLRTNVVSLRVTAAGRGGEAAAFPYELSIDEVNDLAIDAVPASSGPISITAGGAITLNSALATDGDLAIKAGGNFTVSAPLSTTRGRLLVEARNLTIGNSLRVLDPRVDPTIDDIVLTASAGDLNLTGAISAVNNVRLVQRNDGGTVGKIFGPTRVVGRGVTVDAAGAVDVRTSADFLQGRAGGSFAVDELDDITIPALRSGGFVTLRAGGVDPGLGNIVSPNAIALTATLQDVTGIEVSAPRGSISVTTNTDSVVALGNAAAIAAGKAQNMEAAGSVLVRSIAGPLSIADAPIGGGAGVPVRVATTAPLAATFAYNQPGVLASTLTATAVGPLVVDGITLRVGDRVLVRNQANRAENGVYDVTVAGSFGPPGRPWLLTRTLAVDTTAELPANSMVRVLEGSSADRNFTIGYETTFGRSPLVATPVTNRSGSARVRVATTTVLPGTYAAGGPGTLGSISGSGAMPMIDGVTLAVGNRVLVRLGVQTMPAGLPAAAANGVYEVTNVGGPLGTWSLTRAIDVDTGRPIEIGYVAVAEGTFRAATTGQGFRLGYDSLGIDPMTVTAVATPNGRPVTNIGSDDITDVATFIVSSSAGTNDAGGSLGKMIRLRQQNDPSTSRNPAQKTDFRFSALIDRPILLTQELPLITQSFPLDGAPAQRFVPAGVAPPATPAPLVVSGLSITQTLANTGVFRGTGTATISGSARLTVPGTFPNFEELRPGMTVSGPGIRPGSRIAAIDGVNRFVTLTDPIEFVAGQSVAVTFVTEVNGFQFAPGSAGGRLANLFVGGFETGSAVRVTAPAGAATTPGGTSPTVAIDGVTIGQAPGVGRIGNEFGVMVAGSGSARITGGTITSSTGAAIRTQDAATGVIIAGTTIGREGDPNVTGIDVNTSGTVDIGLLTVAPATDAPRTTIAFNRVGVVLRNGTTRIVNTTITGNNFEGIRIEGGNYHIGTSPTRDDSSNVIARNGGWGIDLSATAAPANPQTDARRIQGNLIGVLPQGVAAANVRGNVAVGGTLAANALGFRPRASGVDVHGNLHAPMPAAPTMYVAQPLDNAGADLDPADNRVRIEGEAARGRTQLVLALEDDADAIANATVTSAAFDVRFSPTTGVSDWNAAGIERWTDGVNYTFRYDAATRRVIFESTPGSAAGFPAGDYRIAVNNAALRDVDGNELQANDVAGPGSTAFVVALVGGPTAPPGPPVPPGPTDPPGPTPPTPTTDEAAPTVGIASSVAALAAGQTALVTFTLSKPAGDFTVADVTVTGGTLSNFVGSGTTYTAVFTPTAGSTLPATVSVEAGRFTDAGGRLNVAGLLTPAITVDTVSPTVTIRSSAAALAAGQSASITFTLSEPAAAFTSAAVTVTGGALTGFSGSGTSYTALFTPAAGLDGLGTIRVTAGRFTDAAGNPNAEASLLPPLTIDTIAPTVAITASASRLAVGESATISFTLSEPATDFTAGDVAVSGGLLTDFAGAGTAYSARFTPRADSTGPASIVVAAGAFTDAVGNPNVAGTLATPIVVDSTPPTVTIAGSAPAVAAGQTVTVTFTLSEPSADFGAADVTVTGGTLTNFTGSGATYTAVFAPVADVAGTATISVGAGGFTDGAGNANLPSSVLSIAVDTLAPVITRFTSPTGNGPFRIGDAMTLVATLSEAVRPGGSLTVRLSTGASVALSSATGGSTLSGTYVVQPGEAADRLDVVAITPNGSIVDLAGNRLTSTALPPAGSNLAGQQAIQVAGAVTALSAGELGRDPSRVPNISAVVRRVPITFSTPVTGVTLSSFRLSLNGRSVSLRNARLTGGGRDYVLLIPAGRTQARGTYSLEIVGNGSIRSTVADAAMTEAVRFSWSRGLAAARRVAAQAFALHR
jgi:hypothetical protein